MGKKAKYRKMLRQPAVTQPSRESAPVAREEGRRMSDRERMRRVLWKMVERYEQELGGEGKPCVSGSQAISAMRMLRDLEREEAEEAEAEKDAEAEQILAQSREDFLTLAQRGYFARKEPADAVTALSQPGT